MNIPFLWVLITDSELHFISSFALGTRLTPNALSSPEQATGTAPVNLGIDVGMAGELVDAVAGAVDQVQKRIGATGTNQSKHPPELGQQKHRHKTASKKHLRPGGRPSPSSLYASLAPESVPGQREPCAILGGLFSANLSNSCCFGVNVLTQRSLQAYGLAKPCLAKWSCEKNGFTPTVKFERNAARQVCKEEGCSDAVAKAMYSSWLTWRSANKIASLCHSGDAGIDYAPKVASAVAAYVVRANHTSYRSLAKHNRSRTHGKQTINGTRAIYTMNRTQKHTGNSSKVKSEVDGSTSVEKSDNSDDESDASSSDDDDDDEEDDSDDGDNEEEDEWTLEKCQKAHCDPEMIKDGNSEREMFCEYAGSEEGETKRGHPCFKHCCEAEGACFPGDAIVYTRDRGNVSMAALRAGDDVLAETFPGGPLRYEPVLAFLHRRTEKGGIYVEVVHDGGRLRVSPNHLVFVTAQIGRVDKPAGEIKVGDRLILVDGSESVAKESKVLEVYHRNQAAGMYAPLTYSGTIVVDGVIASNYATPEMGVWLSHSLAHVILLPLRLCSSLGLPKLFSTLTTAFCDAIPDLLPQWCEEEVAEFHPYVSLLWRNLQVHRLLPSS